MVSFCNFFFTFEAKWTKPRTYNKSAPQNNPNIRSNFSRNHDKCFSTQKMTKLCMLLVMKCMIVLKKSRQKNELILVKSIHVKDVAKHPPERNVVSS